MRIRLLLFFTISIFIASCEKDSYKYTPLYPTPPPDYYETVSLGTAYNGNLIVAGNFTHLFNSSNYIAQWNGISWQGLGSGLNSVPNAFATYNGNLIVGGYFTSAGNQSVQCITQWNGSSWSSLPGGGVSMNANYSSYPVPGINSLIIYNGNLVAGGSFEFAGGVHSVNIAQWNGSAWQKLGPSGTDTPHYYGSTAINALAIYNGNLIAAGNFSSIGGNNIKYLAQWNGSNWSNLGSGCNNSVNKLFVNNNILIAMGSFDSIGGIPAMGIASWNGTNWNALNQLVNPTTLSYFITMLNYGSNWYYDGISWVDSTLTQWNGIGSPTVFATCSSTKERWHDPGVTPFMRPLCIYNGNLIGGGWFTSVNGVSCNNNLAQWNGTNWSSPF